MNAGHLQLQSDFTYYGAIDHANPSRLYRNNIKFELYADNLDNR